MDVFSAFPNAIEENVWEIGTLGRATEIGDVYSAGNFIDVIVEEEATGDKHRTPNADSIFTDTLLYVRPDDLPTLDSAALCAGYLLKNTDTGQFYQIKAVDVGKNQENGQIEHIEMWIRPTEALDE